MSRSVMIPTRRSFSDTGMAPMSSCFIFFAACISVASAGMSSILAVITSRSNMADLLLYSGGCSSHSSPLRSPGLLTSRPDESQEIGVNDLGVRRTHAVRELLVDLQRALLEKLCGKRRRISDGDDLIVVAVHDQRRHVDDLQVFGEVGLREGLDAVVLRLGATHHCLAPPVVDHALRDFRAGSVVTVEGPARDIEVELCTIGGKLLAKTVERLDWRTARIARRLHHDRRHSADEHQLGDAAFAVAGEVSSCLAAAGRMADVDSVAQVEVLDDGGGVGGIMVHVVAVADLARPAVSASVVGDDAIAVPDEVEHLVVPVVG